MADPRSDLAPLRDEIVGAVARVVDGGAYVLGPEVASFEEKFAARLGMPGAVGVASGTDALVLGLLSVGVAAGDEVITVSHTSGATVAAIRIVGAVPVLVDIDAATYCLDANLLKDAISPRTKAILPVHLYGHPADLAAIGAASRAHGLAMVEDCAQAQEATINGRPVGSIGEVGCFSFYPTKNLGAIGDGGLVTGSTPELVDRLRRLRTYGWSKPQYAEIQSGRCSRLDELQAAILNVRIDHLSHDVERRRAIAQRYNAGLADLPLVLPSEQPGCRHVYHLYVVRCDRRDELAKHLRQAGVATGIHYPFPVHEQPGLVAGARIPRPLKTTDAIVPEILSLPLYPSISSEDQEWVIDSVRSFFAAR
jgi:dTDP-4-amino-4,6-dideoxygalactose transaminase